MTAAQYLDLLRMLMEKGYVSRPEAIQVLMSDDPKAKIESLFQDYANGCVDLDFEDVKVSLP